MYYLQIVRTQYRIPDVITYLDFAILQYYSLQHYLKATTKLKLFYTSNIQIDTRLNQNE